MPPSFLPRLPHRQLALHAFCAASTLGLAKRLARGVPECVCVCVLMWVCAVLVSPNSRLRVSAPPPRALAMKLKQHIALSASCFRVSKVWAWLAQLSAIYLHKNVSLTSPVTSVPHPPSTLLPSPLTNAFVLVFECYARTFIEIVCSLFFLGFCFQLLLFLNHKLELRANAKCLSILQELLHALRIRESSRIWARRGREVCFLLFCFFSFHFFSFCLTVHRWFNIS